ncbi:MAG: hypothetical protein E7158_01380 [Firmicutes bacterium]|nr:hypothetical protein [Bacillota bacterium]
MKEFIIDGIVDTLKLLPYLLVTFIILEFIEHKFSNKSKKILTENKKYGPILGGLLGGLPQCGFGVVASNLFSSKVITMGTVIAVFLSTSDEMLPIMLSERTNIGVILEIIGFKIIIGIIIGFIVDLIIRDKGKIEVEEVCHKEHCHCDHENLFISSIKHTLKIALFILIANLLINTIIFKIGEENLSNLLLNKNILTYFIASLIGLIPNCASSVIITELYLSELITIGTLLSGLLTGCGLGLLVLFRTNKNIKENITILSVIYVVGVIVGIIVDIFI